MNPAATAGMPRLPESAGLLRVDHVAVAMPDIATGMALFSDALGGRFLNGGDADDLAIRTAQFAFPGGMKVELMQPLREGSYLARFIERHGQGFHHMTLLFDDVEVAIARMVEHGYQLVDTDLSRPSWRETFVRPKDGCGTLLQLVDSTHRWEEPASTSITADDVLAGRVVWDEHERPVLRAGR